VKDQWKGSNIDLTQLADNISQFFTERQFETKLKKSRQDYEIEAKTEKVLNAQLKIYVSVYGEPNNLTVEFTTDKKTKGAFSPSMIIAYLMQAFGGGAIFRGEVKLQEAVDKLESTFWHHVDEQVALLTNPNKT
jgi:hypothetical protein